MAACSPPTPAQQHRALRQCARPRARAGGRAADGAVWEWSAAAAQGQYRLLPGQLSSGSEGNTRHYHSGGAEAGAAGARVVRCVLRGRHTDAGARSVRPLPGARSAAVQAFEYMSAWASSFVLKHIPGAALPLAKPAMHYVAGGTGHAAPRCRSARVARSGAGAGARPWDCAGRRRRESEAQRAAIWRLREEHFRSAEARGCSVKNDVSVPISRVPEFIGRATVACERLIPGIRAVPSATWATATHFISRSRKTQILTGSSRRIMRS